MAEKININNVISRLCLLTGEDIKESYSMGAETAVKRLEHMLKENADLEGYRYNLENTAALMAYMQLIVLENISSPSEVKAGEVSIKNSADIRDMENLINEELRLLAPILRDNNFFFEAVEIYG